jgi:hypothetical protein
MVSSNRAFGSASVVRKSRPTQALGVDQVLNRLPYRAVASVGLADEARRGLHLTNSVRRAHRKANTFEHRKVVPVVTHRSGFLERNFKPCKYFAQLGTFVLDTLMQVGDAEFFASGSKGVAGSARDDGDLEPKPHPCRDGEAVFDVKAFGFIALAVEIDRAVGEATVDIEDDELDMCGVGSQRDLRLVAHEFQGNQVLHIEHPSGLAVGVNDRDLVLPTFTKKREGISDDRGICQSPGASGHYVYDRGVHR